MIVDSTPSYLICSLKDGREVVFEGEWTLEPKFYVNDTSSLLFRNGEKLSDEEIAIAINTLLEDAKERGWKIAV